jgi:hypothetical protein
MPFTSSAPFGRSSGFITVMRDDQHSGPCIVNLAHIIWIQPSREHGTCIMTRDELICVTQVWTEIAAIIARGEITIIREAP